VIQEDRVFVASLSLAESQIDEEALEALMQRKPPINPMEQDFHRAFGLQRWDLSSNFKISGKL